MRRIRPGMVVVIRCLVAVNQRRWLNGDKTGKVTLVSETIGASAGTRWKVEDAGNGTVRFQCLIKGEPRRWLVASSNGGVGLALEPVLSSRFLVLNFSQDRFKLEKVGTSLFLCGNTPEGTVTTTDKVALGQTGWEAFTVPLGVKPNSRRDSSVGHLFGYDYVPSIMLDGDYRMWWCRDSQGDHIFYQTAKSVTGPWNLLGSVFKPSPGFAEFDALNACDPCVLRVNGTYFMYYGGQATDEFTRMGVATSKNGINWTRLNNGKEIISPKRLLHGYGAGQPSAILLDGLIYLIFTDTGGFGGNQGNGAGQYVLRSADPEFEKGVQELRAYPGTEPTPCKHP